MIPQLTFHIGDPKTGTSSIQYALHKELVDCGTQRIAFWRQPNAIPLARALEAEGFAHQAERYGEVRNWLVSLDVEHAVISTEFFSGCDPNVLHQALSTHVPDHAASARIIAYVRPHHDRFLAQFIQRTKAGNYYGGIRALLKDSGVGKTLQYTRRFGGWRATFGDNFTLRPFLRQELHGQDAVTDFLRELLGDSSFSLTEKVEENVAVPLHALAGLRLMQRRFRKAGIGEFGRAILGGAMSTQFLPAGPLVGEKPVLDRTTVEILSNRYRSDAAELDKMFFGRPLMQKSLERAADRAVDTPIDLTPDRHFETARKKQIVALSDDIAHVFRQKPALWPMSYRHRKGQVDLSPQDAAELDANSDYLQDIEIRLAELANLMR